MDRPMPAFDPIRHPMPMSAPPTQGQFNFSAPDLESGAHSDELDEGGAGSDNDNDSLDQLDSAGGPNRKGRRPPSTAEKRANHNAVERARRENLNVRFTELARALPNMNANKRPSKSAIVLRSLEYVQSTRMREQAYENQNAALRAEVNELRAKLGIQPLGVGPRYANEHGGQQEKHKYFGAPPLAHHAQRHPSHGHQFGSAPSAVDAGPYLPVEPLAAPAPAPMTFPNYSFVDHRRPSLATSNGSGHESDSEASLVQTPPQPTHFGAGSGAGPGPSSLYRGGEAPRGLAAAAGGHHGGPTIPGIGNFNNVSCSTATPAPPSWASVVGGYGLQFPMYA